MEPDDPVLVVNDEFVDFNVVVVFSYLGVAVVDEPMQ